MLIPVRIRSCIRGNTVVMGLDNVKAKSSRLRFAVLVT